MRKAEITRTCTHPDIEFTALGPVKQSEVDSSVRESFAEAMLTNLRAISSERKAKDTRILFKGGKAMHQGSCPLDFQTRASELQVCVQSRGTAPRPSPSYS